MDCDICYYNNKINDINICKCGFNTCLECIKKIDKIYCVECNSIFEDKIIKKIDNDTLIYKKYYVLLKLNSYSPNIIKKIIINIDNKKLLRFGTKTDKASIIFIFPCKKKDCTGYVNINYMCKKCNNEYCKMCDELIIENHKCNEFDLKSMEIIKENYKRCPFCYTYIEKTEGCNDMKCICCGIYFNWSNMLINDNKNSNNHYKDIILRTDLHDLYNKQKNDKHYPETQNYKRFIYIFIKDIESKILFKNILNKISKYSKKISILEYNYFIENKKINDNTIKKLYYLYKSIEYFNIICYSVYEYKLKNPSDTDPIINTKFFNSLITYFEKKNYPDKVKYYYKNKYINKQNSIKLFKIFSYRPKKYINRNYISSKDYNLYDILKKFQFCNHINTENSKYIILNTLRKLNIINILIISNDLLIKQWKEFVQFFKFNIIFIPIKKIDLLFIKPNDFIKICDSKFIIKKNFKNFINNKGALILDFDYCYEDNVKKITGHLIKYFVKKNLYFINVSNNNYKSMEMLKKILYCERNDIQYSNFQLINMLFYKLTLKEVFDIILNSPIEFCNTNDKYINNTGDISNYAIERTFRFTIYRLNDVFYIYNNVEKEMITQSHKICKTKNRCLYCKKCSVIKHNVINHSICCHVHSLSFINTKPKHKIYINRNKPLLNSINPNLSLIKKNFDNDNKYKIYKNFLIYYLEILGLSMHDIGLIYNNCYFINYVKNYMFRSTISKKPNVVDFITHKINLNEEDKKALKYAYEHFDIVKNHISIFENLMLKGSMINEQVYLKYIHEYILSVYNKNNLKNQKIIVLLQFNENIKDLVKYLETITSKVLYITGKTKIKKKYNILKMFQKSNNNILILNFGVNIYKLDLRNFYTHIIYIKYAIINICLKINTLYTNKFKSIIKMIE